MLKAIEIGKSIARSLYLAIEVLIRQCTNLVRSNCGSLFCCQTPCDATDNRHSSIKHDMCAVSVTNQRLLRTLYDRTWKDQRSHDAMNELSTRPKAQVLQQIISAHPTKTSCTAVSATIQRLLRTVHSRVGKVQRSQDAMSKVSAGPSWISFLVQIPVGAPACTDQWCTHWPMRDYYAHCQRLYDDMNELICPCQAARLVRKRYLS